MMSYIIQIKCGHHVAFFSRDGKYVDDVFDAAIWHDKSKATAEAAFVQAGANKDFVVTIETL